MELWSGILLVENEDYFVYLAAFYTRAGDNWVCLLLIHMNWYLKSTTYVDSTTNRNSALNLSANLLYNDTISKLMCNLSSKHKDLFLTNETWIVNLEFASRKKKTPVSEWLSRNVGSAMPVASKNKTTYCKQQVHLYESHVTQRTFFIAKWSLKTQHGSICDNEKSKNLPWKYLSHS